MNDPLPLDSRAFLVLHASVTGTAIDTAERIGRRARREGWAVTVKSVAQFNQVRPALSRLYEARRRIETDSESQQAELLEHGLVVFVVPTTGNGAAPPRFLPLWTALLHPGLPPDFLEDLRCVHLLATADSDRAELNPPTPPCRYAVFGLGDSSYGKYNWVGKKLSRRLDALGAHAVVERGEGDDQNEWGCVPSPFSSSSPRAQADPRVHARSVESTFPDWLDRFFAAIDPLFAPPPGFTKLPLTATPPARVRLDKVGSLSSLTPPTAGSTPPLWSDDARWARLVRNERVTGEGWYQDVREIELEVEGVEPGERNRLCVALFLLSHPWRSRSDDGTRRYAAGDVLEIRPQNSAAEVERFLGSAGWTAIADDVVLVSPSDPSASFHLSALLHNRADMPRTPRPQISPSRLTSQPRSVPPFATSSRTSSTSRACRACRSSSGSRRSQRVTWRRS